MPKLTLILLLSIISLHSFTPNTSIEITGKITDNAGSTLQGVVIRIKGTTTGAVSDVNGNYVIQVPDSKSELEFSMVGFKNKSIIVGDQKVINVVLEPDNPKLSEVIVTAINGKVAGATVSGTYNKDMYGLSSEEEDDDFDREGYDFIKENTFRKAKDYPLSTFSIDVDAASYSNIRRMLNEGKLPPAGAVRIEEMINYFKYDYPHPIDKQPFSVNTEVASCPWSKDHNLVLINMQAKKIPLKNLPSGNLVFLIDVSGSMGDYKKLPLVKQSIKMLVDQLRSEDKISLCVYAGSAGLVLNATSGDKKQKIKDAVDALEAGGSTAGGKGIELAYKTAKENFIKGGNNRVILCTDGDFNVGVSSDDELERLIEEKRKSGIFLTVLGFGTGNYQDAKMQKLADKGNGNHAYIDQLSEAKKVLVSEIGGTLFTVAKDVKLQIEFNPAFVQGYRLIGYENRMLENEDFDDDEKDAGELGSGQTVTALYEIIPAGQKSTFLKNVDKLKYQADSEFKKSVFKNELMTIKFRYKEPSADISKLLEFPVKNIIKKIENASSNFRFSTAVAGFGMLLRNSSFKQSASYKNVITLAKGALGKDEEGYRKEFIGLVETAASISKKQVWDDSDD